MTPRASFFGIRQAARLTQKFVLRRKPVAEHVSEQGSSAPILPVFTRWRAVLVSLGAAALLVIGAGLLANAASFPAARPQATSSPKAASAAQTSAAQNSAAQAHNDFALTLDAAHSAVHWTLDSSLHTVHGTFTLKRGAIHFDPASGSAGGEIVVDATSGQSGNDSRDKKMHQEILESPKYSEVIFRPDRVDSPSGPITPQGPWTVNIHGTFVLHGAEHEMTVPAQGQFTGDHWRGTAKFSVPFIAWGLKNPSNFLLKVNPAVDLELDMEGTLQPPSAAK